MTKRYIKGSVCDEIVEWLCSNGEPSATFRGGIRVAVRLTTKKYIDIEFSLLRDGEYGARYVPHAVVSVDPHESWSWNNAAVTTLLALLAMDAQCDTQGLWESLQIEKGDL